MAKVKDITRQRFGMLTVVGRSGISPSRHTTWLCKCDCGNETVVDKSDLIKAHTRSCGCLKRNCSSLLNGRKVKHGKTDTRLFNVWRGMKRRCHSPTDKDYDRYGGRGIAVCDEWRNDFQLFYDWAMENGYDENAERGQCTIDRIDNNKGYSPDNCRWVDQKTQNNNKSSNRHRAKG